MCELYISLERKCVQEDPSVGDNIMNPMRYPIFNITACVWVLSDTFSLQWDIFVQDRMSHTV